MFPLNIIDYFGVIYHLIHVYFYINNFVFLIFFIYLSLLSHILQYILYFNNTYTYKLDLLVVMVMYK